MNHARIDSSNIVRFIRNSGFLLLSLFACVLPVRAEIVTGEYENTFGSNVSGLISQFGLSTASSTPSGVLFSNGYYYRYRVVSSESTITPTLIDGNTLHVPVNVIYCEPDSSNRALLFFYDRDTFSSGYVYVCLDSSRDQLVWSELRYYLLEDSYTFSDSGITGTNIFYKTFLANSPWNGSYLSVFHSSTGDIPVVGTGASSVLAVLSSNSEYWPWKGTTSSGGRTWDDGTKIDGENTSRYSQVFIVMDFNDDNSVTEEEVNYYNYNYNTNYDYSVFNEGDNFDQDQFLYWVAKQIEVGVENPGGGTGSGGGSDSVTGGITVTDSFTQTQTQTIEENAVNVTVNNNNSLTQENYQELNSLINNYNGSSDDDTDPFQQAIGNFQAFHGIALAFAGLASIVFGWLPWWVTALLGAMFSMVCVFIVLRLIHLFK